MATKLRQIIFHVLGCILFLSIPVIFSPDLSESFRLLTIPPFQRDFLGYVLVLTFFYFNFYWLLPSLYFKRRYILYGFCLVLCYLLIAGLPQLLIRGHYFHSDTLPPHEHISHGRHHFGLLHHAGHHLFQFLVVIAFSMLLKMQNRLKQTEKERVTAELAYLRAQVNPHFLFNTLNSIYSLAIEKSDKTAKAIVDLSNLMRYVTTEAQHEAVSLDNEIIYITNYINLQLIRLGDTVKIDFKLRGKMDSHKIAPLMLIPFVENAFKFGINPELNTFIRILIEVEDAQLHMNVFNLVVNEDKSGTGSTLRNVAKRLEAIYPTKHSLLIIDEKTEYTIDLKIDLE